MKRKSTWQEAVDITRGGLDGIQGILPTIAKGAAPKTLDIFTEAIDLSEATLDVGQRLLRDVVLITAGMSKNRRYYGEAVLKKARGLFEGAKAYNDHSMWGHPPTSLTGWYGNVRYDKGRLIADRYFTGNQAGRDIMAIADDIVSGRAPKTLAGLSIAVAGEGADREYDDGIALEVTAITAVSSVDDVTEPAAGGAYLAAGASGGLLAAALAGLSYEDWQATRPDLVARLKKEWKSVRLDEATKTALAEADRKVQAAATEAGTLTQALETAQATIASLTAERDAAAANEVAARRELLVLETLEATPGLPAAFRDDLRKTLREADPAEWPALLQRERKKVRALPRERVPVNGADVQEHVTPAQAAALPSRAILPQEGESPEAWATRIAQL